MTKVCGGNDFNDELRTKHKHDKPANTENQG